MGISYKTIDEPFGERVDKCFGLKNSLIEVMPGKVLMPPQYMEIGEKILNVNVREDDVWCVSYARTGSTWTQEMVWLIGNDFDFDASRKNIQLVRAPLLELSAVLVHPEYEQFMKAYGNSLDVVENTPSPRFLKSHLTIDLLPTELMKIKPKIVYVARNPKDMCVSYYHHCQLLHGMNVEFNEFCELFLNDMLPLGSIWNHYFGFWKLRNEPNVLFLKYEDMKKDLRRVIRQTAEFLEKPVTNEQVDALFDYLGFENMKTNRAVNFEPIIECKLGKDYQQKTGASFIRKGETGDHKNHMTPEMSKRFDEWIEKNTKGTGLSFDV